MVRPGWSLCLEGNLVGILQGRTCLWEATLVDISGVTHGALRDSVEVAPLSSLPP